MIGRLHAESFYNTQITQSVMPISASWDPYTEFTINVQKAPLYDQWWVFLDFTNPTKRDLVFFHAKTWNILTYYRKNRDLLLNGANALEHTAWSTIQMNDVSMWINFAMDNIEDFWYVEHIDSTNIKVYGGNIFAAGTYRTVVDQNLDLTALADWDWYVYYNYATNLFATIANLSSVTTWYTRIAKVTKTIGIISDVDDLRSLVWSVSYDTDFFSFNANGELIIADNAITTSKILNSAVTKAKIDFTGITTTDIVEWTNLYYTEWRVNANPNVAANTAARHTHANKALLDTYTQTEVDIADAIAKEHVHANKALLDTYTQSNADIINAISLAHSHANKTTLDLIPDASTALVSQVLGKTAPWVLGWITQSGWGGGVFESARESFNGDWVDTVWTLSNPPVASSVVWLFNDSGQRYFDITDYTIVWDVITFNTAPWVWRVIYAEYFYIPWITPISSPTTWANIGSWTGVYSWMSGTTLLFRSLMGEDGITVYQNGDTIMVKGTTPIIPLAWEANTSSNEWSWYWLAMPKNGVNLPFKTLLDSETILIEEWTQELTINVDEAWLAPRLYRHFMFSGY